MQRYQRLFGRAKDSTTGAQLVVEAMLQSPNFLFRLDEVAQSKWKPYATASRLSYALWDTMPDARLLEAASRGELSTPAEIQTTAAAACCRIRARTRRSMSSFPSGCDLTGF